MPGLKRSRDGFTRGDVVNAFQNAFDMIGGVQRLALWANENPGKFYQLYAKLLPATTINLGDSGKLIIEHRLAPTALDRHDPVILEEEQCQSSRPDTSPVGTSTPSTEETSDGPSSWPIAVRERP